VRFQGEKDALQRRANECVEQLSELCSVLDVTDEQHNDDSLMQFFLFSRC
jgi:hypothetical protein